MQRRDEELQERTFYPGVSLIRLAQAVFSIRIPLHLGR